MKRKLPLGLFGLLAMGSASAQSLYYVGTEAQESLPLKWVAGFNAIYDDNVAPGYGSKEGSLAANPYVGLSFVSITPQTTWDVFARLGVIYYFDAPSYIEDLNPQSRAGITMTHRFSERLRFTSRNFISYELEPDYSYGYASSRRTDGYFFWYTDDSVGYRWTERFGTYTGIRLKGTSYSDSDIQNSDWFTWEVYNQFRYQLSPQTVLTAEYRYAQSSGDSDYNDATDHYLLIGAEHRFSPNTVGIVRAGAQIHDMDNGGGTDTSPYVEFALNSQINPDFRIKSYARYGLETYDNIQFLQPYGQINFDQEEVLRIGVSGEYAISPRFSIFGGLDYIPSTYQDGRTKIGNIAISDKSTDIINAYLGLSMKINDYLTGTLSYNYTNSSSDFESEDYDRNRISVGLSAEF